MVIINISHMPRNHANTVCAGSYFRSIWICDPCLYCFFEPRGLLLDCGKFVGCACARNALVRRHNGHSSVSNHQPHDCLHNRLFRRRSQKTSKLRATGLCVGNSPGPVNSPHKGPVTRKMFPFDDVIMARNIFPATTGKPSRHASRHVRHTRAVLHNGVANQRFSFIIFALQKQVYLKICYTHHTWFNLE